MFGRNKRIDKNVDLILKRLKKYDKVDFESCIRKNEIDIMQLSKNVDKLNEKIDKILDITQIEADYIETIKNIFSSIASPATIAEAEERMQTLSNKIDELEAERRKLIAALGGVKSGNNKLKKAKKVLQLDKKKLLKELNAYKKNGAYIHKTLPPTKSKPQKTRLKNRVTNTQTKEILKDISSERVA